MDTTPTLTADLLERHLAGETTPAEDRRVESWLDAAPDRRAVVTAIQAGPPARGVQLDADATWNALAHRLELGARPPRNGAVVRPIRPYLSTTSARPAAPARRFGRLAGIAGLVVSAVLLATLGVRTWLRQSADAAANVATHTYETKRAQRATVTLPDGTRAVLGPETQLGYRIDRNGARYLDLRGQAYFTVTHDPRRTFTVYAGGVATRVLGTSFMVRAYPEDQRAQIAVAEGKVSVDAGITQSVLLPGDVAHAAPGTDIALTHDARVSDLFGWMLGQFTFKDMPLRDVVAEMARVYDLDIRIASPVLAARRVSGSFADESPTAVLNLITLAADAAYVRHGRVIELRAR